VILKSAVKQFLKRPRDDHRWLKGLKKQEVDELIASLEPKPKLWPHLMLHQKISFYLGVAYGSFAYWLDMGSGKTLVALELMKYWYRCGAIKRCIVFVITDKAFPTWETQIERFKIGLPVVALEGSSEHKWEQLEKFKHGIVLVTYAGATAMCSETVQRKGKKKANWKLDKGLMNRLCDGAGMLVMDESTRAGNDQSLSHKLCDYLSDRLEYRYALAGRPFGRDPTLLWAQQRLIDEGVSLGETKAIFQEAFFSKVQNPFARSRYVFDYTFRKEMMPKLTEIMQHRSISYEESEFQDVAKVNRIVEPVYLSRTTRKYYDHGVKELAKAKGNFVETKNLFLKLRQMTSGFVGIKDDETGEKASLEFDDNPKLDRLLELIQEVPLDRKAVVFYDYTWSAKKITSALPFLLDIKCIWLWSGTKDFRSELKQFANDSKCRVAVINNKVGAYSLDGLQEVANYLFFYESPVSVIDREQAEKRLNRKGQKRRVWIYDLAVTKSVDMRILAFHKEGKDLMEMVRKNPEGLLE
jgi:hypothetical protein